MRTIKNIVGGFYRLVTLFGFDPIKLYKTIKNLPWFISTYISFSRKNKTPLKIKKIFLCLHEKNNSAGTATGHYFHQDLFVAQRIFQMDPIRHIDIGSSISGFVSHVATFRKIEIIDVRDLPRQNNNISFVRMDLSKPVPKEYYKCCDSLSSLHAIEHFGLGRYGDSIDPAGYISAVENIYAMLKPSGYFYFSVPIGPDRIEFNAHRVFSLKTLLKLFEYKFEILSFSFVDDNGDFHKFIDLKNTSFCDDNFGCYFGCGIFELKKM